MVGESTLMLGLLIASVALNLIIMVFVILIFRKMNSKSSANQEQSAIGEAAATRQTNPSTIEGIVFCRNCGTQHNSSDAVCPNCKTPR